MICNCSWFKWYFSKIWTYYLNCDKIVSIDFRYLQVAIITIYKGSRIKFSNIITENLKYFKTNMNQKFQVIKNTIV